MSSGPCTEHLFRPCDHISFYLESQPTGGLRLEHHCLRLVDEVQFIQFQAVLQDKHVLPYHIDTGCTLGSEQEFETSETMFKNWRLNVLPFPSRILNHHEEGTKWACLLAGLALLHTGWGLKWKGIISYNIIWQYQAIQCNPARLLS